MGTSENQGGGVSRRDLLKKGAVAGGIVWTAPIVLSSPAGAQAAGSAQPCNLYYRAKFELQDDGTFECVPGVGAQDCLFVTGRTYESACGLVLGPEATADGFAVYIPTSVDGLAVQDPAASTKAGSNNPNNPGGCGPAQPGDPAIVTRDGKSYFELIAPGEVNQLALSHLEVTFCVYDPTLAG